MFDKSDRSNETAAKRWKAWWSGSGATIYRNGYSPGFYQLFAGLYVLMAVFLLIFPPPSVWQLVVIPLNLGPALLFWRMSRMGARLEERGVTIIRMFRTIRIPWSRFQGFVILPKPRDLIPKTGYVKLTDGSLVWIQGMAPWFGLIRKSDDFVVEALIHEMSRKARRLKEVAESARPQP